MTAGLIPLSTATTLALARLAPEHDEGNVRGAKERNAVAVALSGLIPIYKGDPSGSQLQKMSEEELGAGRFIEGATRFVFADDRPDIDLLAVNEGELDDAIDTIAAAFIGRGYMQRARAGA